MLGSKEGKVTQFRSVPGLSQAGGRDQQVSSQCPHLGEEAAHEGPQAWAGLVTRNLGRLPGKGGIGG